MPSNSRNFILYGVVFAVVFCACIFKIADLDFWWHLKTGQVILQQKAFQHQEIYSFTANGREYIDHEWLFQVIQYVIYSIAGPAGIIFFKTAIFTVIYLLIARYTVKRGASSWLAASLILLSICGALPRLIERPEMFSILYLLITYLLVDSYLRDGKARRLAFLPVISIVWANTHAAVILGLILQFAFLAGIIGETILARGGYPSFYGADNRKKKMLATILGLSLICTGLNPYGFRVLTVPFELTSIINSGVFANQEWQQPSPYTLPFFYLCVMMTFGITLIHFRKLSIVHLGLSAFFGFIALKYIRNTGLFCIFMPILVSPYLASLSQKRTFIYAATGLLSLATLVLLTFTFPFERGIGIASYFPQKMVRFTTEKNLTGNMLNAYAFGGYFIWTLYPDRKVFIDGRNEVYLPLMQKVVEVRSDSRKWKQFLDDYGIDYALLNYVDDLEDVSSMDERGQVTKKKMPFSSTHFPRSRWALIDWSDEGMVLIRRTGKNQGLLPLEYPSVFPEGYSYETTLVQQGKIDRSKAIEEINRKLNEDPSCERAKQMLQEILHPGVQHEP